jgi:hypothetical protein
LIITERERERETAERCHLCNCKLRRSKRDVIQHSYRQPTFYSSSYTNRRYSGLVTAQQTHEHCDNLRHCSDGRTTDRQTDDKRTCLNSCTLSVFLKILEKKRQIEIRHAYGGQQVFVRSCSLQQQTSSQTGSRHDHKTA